VDADRQALPHTVYRMYCQKNRLLYVGMTLFFESRMREHER
jgi:predicted GIY-YIG superfamily endonuclease